jgi:hypothetical protein
MVRIDIYEKDPQRIPVLEPPLPHQSCDRCEHQELCHAHLSHTKHLLCEVLSTWDLVCAERDGVLQDVVWWQQLPPTATAEIVASWGQR